MRICFLEGDMSRSGGTERMTAWLTNALCEAHEVYILSLRLTKDAVFFSLKDKATHEAVPSYPGKLGILKQIRWISDYLKKNSIDRVINVDVGMGFYGILAAKGTDAKVITWEHGNFYNNWGSRLFPYLRRYAAKKSHAVVVLTDKDRRNYMDNIKRCVPVYTIPNPAERHDYTYDVSSKTILSVGHLLRNKGYHRVVEMAKQILPEHPDWRWVICGEGPEREKLEKAIAEAELEKQLLLPGLQKDMDTQYQSAAMLVMTSDMEGLPMTLLEGKSWGLPLVAFDIMTGPSDIITDGVNGYLVEPFDTDEMAGRIASLMDGDELRAQMSAQSQHGVEQFDQENIVQKWEKLLKEV